MKKKKIIVLRPICQCTVHVPILQNIITIAISFFYSTSSDYKIHETFNFNTVTMIILSPALIIGSYEFISTAYGKWWDSSPKYISVFNWFPKPACGGNFSTLYGAVTSPSWPRAYQANLDCVWIITAPLGNKIELQVHNFTLESTCSGDILEIR